MWQRFSERARKSVFYAQEEAQKFGEGYVSTEHLLLGIVRVVEGVAAETLARLGVSLASVRAEVEKQLPRGDARPSHDMTLTPRTKRSIDLAYEEAKEMGDDYIGTEHLLLGLVREGDGLAGRVLAKLGVEIDHMREVVLAIHQEQAGATTGKASGEKAGPRPGKGTVAYDRLLVLNESNIPPTMAVLLMALADPRSAVVKLLDTLELWPRDVQCIFENSILAAEMGACPNLDECLAAAGDLAKLRSAPAVTSADLFAAYLGASDLPSLNEYLAANDSTSDEIWEALKQMEAKPE